MINNFSELLLPTELYVGPKRIYLTPVGPVSTVLVLILCKINMMQQHKTGIKIYRFPKYLPQRQTIPSMNSVFSRISVARLHTLCYYSPLV